MPATARKPRLLFFLTGSISCYKACFAISRLGGVSPSSGFMGHFLNPEP